MNFKESISDNEINDIILEIKNSYGITYYSHNKIKRFKVFSIYNNEELIGVFCYKINKKYIDLKFCIIKQKYRNKGYMKKLLDKFFEMNKSVMIGCSKNPIMIKYLLRRDFKKIRLINLPLKYQCSQFMMIFNFRRICEYLRKLKENNNKFEFFIRNNN